MPSQLSEPLPSKMTEICEFPWRAALKYGRRTFQLIISEFHFVKAQAVKSLLWFKAALAGSENTGIKTHSHSHTGLATNSPPVTHHRYRIEPSSAVRLIIFWGQVTSYSNPVIFGKQRAKVSWMSGVSRRPKGFWFHPNYARRTMNVSVCSFLLPILAAF